MKSTATLALLFVTFLSSVQGLAFVTGIMRPIVNPVAAMKSMRQRVPVMIAQNQESNKPTFLSNTAQANDEVANSKPSQVVDAAFGLDDSTRAYRSEMLDLVYARSMDRMDSFTQ